MICEGLKAENSGYIVKRLKFERITLKLIDQNLKIEQTTNFTPKAENN